MDLTITGLQAMLSMLTLEGVKQLLYILFPKISVDPRWYTLALPLLGFLVLPVASWLSGGALDWTLWSTDVIRQTVLTLLSSLVAMVGYDYTLKPLKKSVEKYEA